MRPSTLLFLALTAGLEVLASPDRRTTFEVDLINPSDVPSQCQSTCNPVVTVSNTCSLASCCTNTIGSEAETCANCIVAADPTTGTLTYAQGLLNGYLEDCALLGIALQPLTASYPSGGSGSTGGASGTSTTPSAAPATTGTAGGGSSSGSSGSSGGSTPLGMAGKGGALSVHVSLGTSAAAFLASYLMYL
ncbi:hypothetical protein HYDPIDRAFT_120293 [Hydnomerulius pinastri MD-312]|uniref:Extracellular membrane protein CFEM domain-containing protein n=1 Tax=Hydnomerulius pinastri MD-312 TaxID=994086 RepID=A0A0C9W5H2_9AGAM|nr:hypothetical protein HYDPIDRAFT_120293 [Hydnomerulius pinastri MD-312]